MKRFIVAALVAACVAAPSTAEAKPNLGRWRGPCSTFAEGENLTPAMYQADPVKGHRQITHLVTCVWKKYAPGYLNAALAIMEDESGGYPWAFNVGGCDGSGCIGLFQHVYSAWHGRALEYLDRWMFGPNAWVPSGYDPRANAIVSARMMQRFGLSPWGG